MANFKIEIKKTAFKEIERLPLHDLKAVMEKIKSLSENPRPYGSKKLSSREDYRIRCGNYRIIYTIQDDVLIICVVKVGHRKDVYR